MKIQDAFLLRPGILFIFGVSYWSGVDIVRGTNDLVGFCGARKAMNLSCASTIMLIRRRCSDVIEVINTYTGSRT
jgi:hypothetical protein